MADWKQGKEKSQNAEREGSRMSMMREVGDRHVENVMSLPGCIGHEIRSSTIAGTVSKQLTD